MFLGVPWYSCIFSNLPTDSLWVIASLMCRVLISQHSLSIGTLPGFIKFHSLHYSEEFPLETSVSYSTLSICALQAGLQANGPVWLWSDFSWLNIQCRVHSVMVRSVWRNGSCQEVFVFPNRILLHHVLPLNPGGLGHDFDSFSGTGLYLPPVSPGRSEVCPILNGPFFVNISSTSLSPSLALSLWRAMWCGRQVWLWVINMSLCWFYLVNWIRYHSWLLGHWLQAHEELYCRYCIYTNSVS